MTLTDRVDWFRHHCLPMDIDPRQIDIEHDVTFAELGSSTELLVLWRKAPIGFIRVRKTIPRSRRPLSAEERQAITSHFRPNIGKWYDSLGPDEYFDTREAAARALISRSIARNPNSPLIAAALRGDLAEVERLVEAIQADVEIVEEDDPRLESSYQPSTWRKIQRRRSRKRQP